MGAPAIRAEGLSKQYRIGERQDRYDTLRNSLTRGVTSLFKRDRSGIFSRERMWALQDVSFEIQPGEVVGIIGQNGAGKTTLLRVLARITEPTSGRAEVRGRLGSLLEVGTGFHPELTGRDNIFLNGAILGMSRRETARKFDEIVDFSGIEKFIDTPVKRYSSGMYMRLAFSVAAHLEPEILLVDEVLAVGDAQFQKKCIGKMQGIGESGRTVLFVSHSMQTIARLCERVILLDSGGIIDDGPAEQTVAKYLQGEFGTPSERSWPDLEHAPGGDVARFRSLRIIDRAGETVESSDVRESIGIEITFDVIGDAPAFVPAIALHNSHGAHIFSAIDTDERWKSALSPGRYTSVAWIPPNLLNEGTHIASISLNTHTASWKSIQHAHLQDALAFQVHDPGEGDTARGNYGAPWAGSVRPLLDWTMDVHTAS
jgi:lipopolysaccharide transport system ATP-binding protein